MSHLIKISLEPDIEFSNNEFGVVYHTKIESKMNFRENPNVHMFYKPQNDEKEELYVPDCDNFIVFYIKRSKLFKT